MRSGFRRLLSLLLPLLCALGACVSNGPLALETTPSCRAAADAGSVRWIEAASADDQRRSMRWCAGIGPPLTVTAASIDESPPGVLTVVSWNTHVGGGDIRSFVETLRAGPGGGRPVTHFVLLLQEVYRTGAAVPARLPPGAKSARRLHHGPPGVDRDIESTARALQLNLLYAPSMRNGDSADTREDRGNAILSTLPLEDAIAIELPHERQRRVAVAATIRLTRADGRVVPIRFTSVHLTNMVGHHGWIFSEPGRTRQARALASALPDGPLIVGGDLNTWFGAWDGAYREVARRVPAARGSDSRPTFMFLRLDHLFFRSPGQWAFTFRRAESRFGSDHYPLVGELRASSYD